MAAMSASNVVIDAQSFAYPDRDGFFAAVQVSQTGHESSGVNLIHLLFKQTDTDHLAIGVKPLFFLRAGGARWLGTRLRLGGCSCHTFLPPLVTGVDTPDMAASTSNMQAKSYFVQPMPRAAVRISLLTAVVGSGTSSCRPRSMASTISFCIMFTSNQASSGCCNTNGPRY